MKRTLWQFDLGTWTDAMRLDAQLLAELIKQLVPQADVSVESAKTDTSVLRIEIDETIE